MNIQNVVLAALLLVCTVIIVFGITRIQVLDRRHNECVASGFQTLVKGRMTNATAPTIQVTSSNVTCLLVDNLVLKPEQFVEVYINPGKTRCSFFYTACSQAAMFDWIVGIVLAGLGIVLGLIARWRYRHVCCSGSS